MNVRGWLGIAHDVGPEAKRLARANDWTFPGGCAITDALEDRGLIPDS
jgi:hypothetical protein